MAYNNTSEINYRVGEQDVIFSSFVGDSESTATILPGSTFTLYDQKSIPVTGITNVPVTGYDDGVDISTGRVWFLLDTTGIAPGIYYGVFSYSITGNDTLVRNLKPDLQITVLAIVESIFTYDPTTLLGLVRTYARDTDPLNPILDDATIDAMIGMSGYNGLSSDLWRTLGDVSYAVLISAAECLDLMARDAAKIALIEKIGAISENTKVTYDALREEADLLRKRASQNFVPSETTCAPSPIEFLPFSLPIVDYGGYTIPNSALDRW